MDHGLMRDSACTGFSRTTLLLLGAVLLLISSHGFGQNKVADTPYTLGTAASLQTIFPEAPVCGDVLGDTLELAAAGNESESAQVVIIARNEPVTIASVSISDLAGEASSVISADHFTIHLVGYISIEKLSWRGVRRIGYWPDPLLTFRPFECPAGQVRCLWVTVHVPANAPAGDYTGQMDITLANGNVEHLPVRLTVWGFTLPEQPRLETSYWTNFGYRYDWDDDFDMLQKMWNLFGRYRISTDLRTPSAVQWFLESDGSVTCDIADMVRNVEYAVAANFKTLHVGPSNPWNSWLLGANKRIIDRATGQTITDEQAEQLPQHLAARLYLNKIADYLEIENLLDRAYIQVWDEAMKPSTWPQIISAYQAFRNMEPRIRLLGLTGIHPQMQGLYDIWSPHNHFYDAQTYQKVREGVRLYGHKNFPAEVSASSTGGWGNASFYTYRPIDAYDGCDYTKWIPAELPTEQTPQWLRFDFDQPFALNGFRVVPYGSKEDQQYFELEVSDDGENFHPVAFSSTNNDMTFSFDAQLCRAIRLVWHQGQRSFVATERQPLPCPEVLTSGIREIEFLRDGVQPECDYPRAQTCPAEIWEYQVGADYPSAAVDADAVEIRASAWQCWMRGVNGYLNYGGGQWGLEGTNCPRPTEQDPLFWPAINNNGASMIVYPGVKQVLPSIRMARFRDGVDDYDYLEMLQSQDSEHPLLNALREAGRDAYSSPITIQTNRRGVAQAIWNGE